GHRKQVVELEHEADVGGTPAREVAAREAVDPAAVDGDGPRRRRVQPADEIQQRGLAGSRGPHERDEVAARDVEIDAVQDLDRLAAAAVRLGDAADLDEHGHFSTTRTAAPSLSDGGGATTTRSPARRPLVISRSAPTVWPGVTLRRSTLPSTYTKTLPSLRTASTGTRTPDATAGVVDAAPRNATRTPMSGTMRGSFEGIAMRTLTVALLRSAVGMIAITEPGIFQSGYALSVASTGCSDATRLMNDSLTSTWISSESMSTMVPMPV